VVGTPIGRTAGDEVPADAARAQELKAARSVSRLNEPASRGGAEKSATLARLGRW